MNNAVFGKTIENIRNHKDIELLTNEARRNYLVSGASYHTIKCFLENFLATKMKRTQSFRNKPVSLGLSIFRLSKILMYKIFYD